MLFIKASLGVSGNITHFNSNLLVKRRFGAFIGILVITSNPHIKVHHFLLNPYPTSPYRTTPNQTKPDHKQTKPNRTK